MNLISLLTGIVVVALLAGCNGNEEMHHSEHGGHMHTENEGHAGHEHMHHEEMESTAPSDMSVYNLTSTWITENKEQIKLNDLSGRVQVVAMVYTTCQAACPRIVADLRRIQDELPEGSENEVGFVLVSIDPAIDTPGRLKAFATENKFEDERWTLLNGNEDDVLELAALLGVQYKKTTGKDYSHSNIITVLNRKGEVVHQQKGLGVEPRETIDAINNLLHKHES